MRAIWLIALAVTSGLIVNCKVYAADDLKRGEVVYYKACIACHAADGAGSLPGVPDLTEKGGALRQEDAVLIRRMAEGFQTPGSPMEMPPRGGDPAVSDADLKAVLKYMRKAFLGVR